MPTWSPVPPRVLPFLCCLVLLAACGGENPASVHEPGVRGKPVPELGSVRCTIVERPARDRAVVEAEWTIGAATEGCELVVELPTGALLVEGQLKTPVAPGEQAGRTRWTVEFGTGRPLDLVIRLCGTTPRGFRIAEAYARLTR